MFSGDEYRKWIQEEIKSALTPTGDLLPPWLRYPDIRYGSIGWRMGPGEVYMMAWTEWSGSFTADQLLEYFRHYAPVPPEWLSFVSDALGYGNPLAESAHKAGEAFPAIRQLEQLGLGSYSDFLYWYRLNWKPLRP
jgi:hypothetical protein